MNHGSASEPCLDGVQWVYPKTPGKEQLPVTNMGCHDSFYPIQLLSQIAPRPGHPPNKIQRHSFRVLSIQAEENVAEICEMGEE